MKKPKEKRFNFYFIPSDWLIGIGLMKTSPKFVDYNFCFNIDFLCFSFIVRF